MHIQNSVAVQPEVLMNMELELIKKMPKYYAYALDEFEFPYERIYPTNDKLRMKNMEVAKEKASKLL